MKLFPSYAEFFHALNNCTPYVWQSALAQSFYDGVAPDVVPVETGMGKTQAVSAWLWAFAKQRSEIISGERTLRTVQTRLHFVVDRRILVDDTALLGEKFADRLNNPINDVLRAVAAALEPTADPSGSVFNVVRLRGGLQARAEHTNSPITPTLATSTLDLFGSRLLFRGYGLSTGRRPIDAALTGIDSLIVLDEAHLAKQFRRTLDVLELQNDSETLFDGAVPPRKVVVMSATANDQKGVIAPFSWDAEIAQNSQIGIMRLFRSNVTVEVVEVEKNALADEEMAASALKLGGAPGTAVAVFVNTVASAKSVRSLIQKNTSADVVVLHGGVPQPVRENVLNKLAPYRTRSNIRANAPALFVVATQTLEVGADIDFDHAITRASSYDSFIQRAGRVNRVGDRPDASITVVSVPLAADAPDSPEAGKKLDGQAIKNKAAADAKKAFAENPVYGEAAVNTAAFLSMFFTMGDVKDTFASLTETAHLFRKEPPLLTLPKPDFADYLYTDGLANEAPVSPWIRPQDPDWGTVQLVWRDALGELPDDAVAAYLQAVPPSSAEAWTVNFSTLRSTVLVAKETGAMRSETLPRFVVIGAQSDLSKEPATVAKKVMASDGIENGMTIVVSSHRKDIAAVMDSPEFGIDFTTAANRSDLFAVLVKDRHDGVGVVNINAARWAELDEEDEDEQSKAVVKALASWHGSKVAGVVDGLDSAAIFRDNIAQMIELIKNGNSVRITDLSIDRSGAASARLLRVYPPKAPEVRQHREDLFEHCSKVGDGAKKWGIALGLPDSIVEALDVAGDRHDLGKLLPQFQHQLHLVVEPKSFALVHDGQHDALAKSSHPSFRRREASALAGIPAGFRHEALSVTLSEQLGVDQGIDGELVSYLIATHHGHGRGLFPTMDSTVVDSNYEVDGVKLTAGNPLQDASTDEWSRWSERFDALVETYGPYTLALAEAILRLSDWQESVVKVDVPLGEELSDQNDWELEVTA